VKSTNAWKKNYIVPLEYSPSSTTKCRGCGNSIKTGSLRVTFKYKRPWHFHFDCYQPKHPSIHIFSEETLKSLDPKDEQHVRERMKKLVEEQQKKTKSLLQTDTRLSKQTVNVKEIFVKDLPLEIWNIVISFLSSSTDINSLGASCKEMYEFTCSHPVWEQVVKNRYPWMIKQLEETQKKLNVSWRSFYLKIRYFNCIHCGAKSGKNNFHDLVGAIVCVGCRKYYKTITKTECKTKYSLNEDDLDGIFFKKTWSRWKCYTYLEAQIAYIAEQKKKRIEDEKKRKYQRNIEEKQNRKELLIKAL
jgi:hypothetical protein